MKWADKTMGQIQDEIRGAWDDEGRLRGMVWTALLEIKDYLQSPHLTEGYMSDIKEEMQGVENRSLGTKDCPATEDCSILRDNINFIVYRIGNVLVSIDEGKKELRGQEVDSYYVDADGAWPRGGDLAKLRLRHMLDSAQCYVVKKTGGVCGRPYAANKNRSGAYVRTDDVDKVFKIMACPVMGVICADGNEYIEYAYVEDCIEEWEAERGGPILNDAYNSFGVVDAVPTVDKPVLTPAAQKSLDSIIEQDKARLAAEWQHYEPAKVICHFRREDGHNIKLICGDEIQHTNACEVIWGEYDEPDENGYTARGHLILDGDQCFNAHEFLGKDEMWLTVHTNDARMQKIMALGGVEFCSNDGIIKPGQVMAKLKFKAGKKGVEDDPHKGMEWNEYNKTWVWA